jgi:LPS sulfotransferase NodH
MAEISDSPTRFVILAAPRTGSNLLCTLLNSHPDILCHHEIFNPAGIFYALDLRDGSFNLGTMETRDEDPVAFMERIWEAHRGHSYVGFKTTLRQNETVFRQVLKERGIKKIVLKRKNRIRTYVSRLLSEQTGQWEAYRPEELVKETRQVEVKLPDLYADIAFNDRYYQEIEGYLGETFQSYVILTYEHLFDSDERMKMLDFLDPSLAAPGSLACLEVKSLRQNPVELRRMISNFDELQTQVQGTELEQDLYPPGKYQEK